MLSSGLVRVCCAALLGLMPLGHVTIAQDLSRYPTVRHREKFSIDWRRF